MHVKRWVTDEGETGRPILEMRWIEYPQGVYGWGFCPIPIDVSGAEIGFAPFTWTLASGVSMTSYLDYKNGPLGGENITGFVSAASDGAVEFVHNYENYEVPADLAPGWSW